MLVEPFHFDDDPEIEADCPCCGTALTRPDARRVARRNRRRAYAEARAFIDGLEHNALVRERRRVERERGLGP